MMVWERLLDVFRGKAVTIPPLDGAWKPNTALDVARLAASIAEPDCLAAQDGRLIVSSGPRIAALDIDTGETRTIATQAADITALAAFSDGGLAVATADGALACLGGAHDGWTVSGIGGRACPTAIAVVEPDTLLVAQGSMRHGPRDWTVDLLEKGAGGSLWRIEIGSGRQTCLADGLAWAAGILCVPGEDRILVSEAWRHRLVSVPLSGASTAPLPVLSRLPGYPGRLAPASGGGAWLSMFAPRNRLVEFVLAEDDYRRAMMAEVDPRYWIAPALSSAGSFLEPLQSGAVVTMGVRKPWAPSRSYGLAARLDASFQPVASFHSRADGRRHGITALAECGGRLFAAARGGDAVLDLGAIEGEDLP